MWFLAALTPSASVQALDCAGRDPVLCEAVNTLVPAVNAAHGSALLTQSSSRAAFRPARIHDALVPVQARATAGGCTITGAGGGVYDAGPAGAWSGAIGLLGGAPDPASGSVSLSPPTWSGAAGPFDIGLDVGVHNTAGQIAADVDDDGFQVGAWLRTSGNRGVWYGVIGTCPPGTDPGAVFDPWYVGDLPDFGSSGPTPVSTSTTSGPLGFSDATGVCMDLAVPGSGQVVAGGVAVAVSLEHPWVGDVTLRLVHPDGTSEATLMSEPPNFDGTNSNPSAVIPTGALRFVDGAPASHDDIGGAGSVSPACPAGATCDFSPLDPLSAFDGLPANGVWRICASDGFSAFDPGVLHGATLSLQVD